MRKIFMLVLGLVLIFNCAAVALESTLMDMRNELFKNAQEIKALFTQTKDPILLTSMWDSCIVAMSQLDAYFSMLGIFNTIKSQNLEDTSFGYLTNWLGQIKKTNQLNITSLDTVKLTSDPKSKLFILKLKASFNKLDNYITKELEGVLQLQKSIKMK